MTEKQIKEIADDSAEQAIQVLSNSVGSIGEPTATFHRRGVAKKILSAAFAATIEVASQGKPIRLSLSEEQVQAVSKAASAIRFTANDGDGLYRTEEAKRELRRIADSLTEIANKIFYEATI